MENKKALTPPSEVSPLDEIVEQKTDPSPLKEVVHGCGWHLPGCGEDDGEEDISEEASWVPSREEVVDYRTDEADQPEPVGPSITTWSISSCSVRDIINGNLGIHLHLASSKHSAGSQNTPDDTGIEEGLRTRTRYALLLIGCADIFNIATQKVVCSNLYNGQPDDCECLGGKHGTRGDLEVVTNFHVRDVIKAIEAHHIAPTLEEHHCHRSSWKPGRMLAYISRCSRRPGSILQV